MLDCLAHWTHQKCFETCNYHIIGHTPEMLHALKFSIETSGNVSSLLPSLEGQKRVKSAAQP
jgi:hypothetical protein